MPLNFDPVLGSNLKDAQFNLPVHIKMFFVGVEEFSD